MGITIFPFFLFLVSSLFLFPHLRFPFSLISRTHCRCSPHCAGSPETHRRRRLGELAKALSRTSHRRLAGNGLQPPMHGLHPPDNNAPLPIGRVLRSWLAAARLTACHRGRDTRARACAEPAHTGVGPTRRSPSPPRAASRCATPRRGMCRAKSGVASTDGGHGRAVDVARGRGRRGK